MVTGPNLDIPYIVFARIHNSIVREHGMQDPVGRISLEAGSVKFSYARFGSFGLGWVRHWLVSLA